ncbi:tetratricopeptide repeat protein [Galbibacter sp.]|uniref:tetratricopeptide repeat protein n=1 Tax=Galbibacter sp. TaxID=2918471 RepID=UPI003A9312BF
MRRAIINSCKIALFLGLMFYAFPTFAQQGNLELFEKANSLYNKGEYQTAIEDYLKISESGQHSAELYYNLGNAYYKLNQIAPSIYYYEKALLLKPKDPDILNNLQYAENMTIDAIDVLPQTGIDRLVSSVVGVFSHTTWAIGSIVFMFLFVVVFLLYYFSSYHRQKRLFFVLSFFMLLLSIAAVVGAYKEYTIQNSKTLAIIFAKETSVTSEPNMGSEEIFQLHEGTKVNVLDTMGGWKKIRLADGKIGWLPQGELKVIKDF